MRNIISSSKIIRVALRKESVDRNILMMILSVKMLVALRKESVDRNVILGVLVRM